MVRSLADRTIQLSHRPRVYTANRRLGLRLQRRHFRLPILGRLLLLATWVQISKNFKMEVENTAKIPKYNILAFQITELLEARSRLYRSQMLQVNTRWNSYLVRKED